jgi:hypothetical protein
VAFALQRAAATRIVVNVVLRVALVLTLPALLACAAPHTPDGFRQKAVSTSGASAPSGGSSFVDPQMSVDDSSSLDDDSAGAIDLYGNQVSDAVAKYKLDPTGSLYELHSPQTELPRLASPKS